MPDLKVLVSHNALVKISNPGGDANATRLTVGLPTPTIEGGQTYCFLCQVTLK
jgi:hypothetical protein